MSLQDCLNKLKFFAQKKTEKLRPKRARLNGKKMTKKNFETKYFFEKQSPGLKLTIKIVFLILLKDFLLI